MPKQLGVHHGALVKVASRRGFAVYPAEVTTRVRPGECFAPIHWNDLFGENLAVNAATSEAVDEISLQPEFKFSAVALSKVAAGVAGRLFRRAKKLSVAVSGAGVTSRGSGEFRDNGAVHAGAARIHRARLLDAEPRTPIRIVASASNRVIFRA